MNWRRAIFTKIIPVWFHLNLTTDYRENLSPFEQNKLNAINFYE